MRQKNENLFTLQKSWFLLFLHYNGLQSAIPAQSVPLFKSQAALPGERTAGQGQIFELEFVNASIAGQTPARTVAC